MNPIVYSHGYSDADIFLLAGYPSNADLKSTLALSDFAETILNGFLKPYHLTVKNTYRSLLIKEKMAYQGARSKNLRAALDKIDYKSYENLLLEELLQVDPNVIVPLDDIALGAVFPQVRNVAKPKGRKYWIYCYRGSILKLREDWQAKFSHPIRVIPTIGPRHLIAEEKTKGYIQLDFQRIIKYHGSKSQIGEYGLRWVCRTSTDLLRFIERGLQSKPTYITELGIPLFLNFDIETCGGMPTCISFSFDGYEACSVPLNDDKVNKLELVLMWRIVSKLLDHPIPKTNQNIKYDWIILERFGLNVRNVFADPMLGMNLIYPELPKGLDFSTSIYTEIPYYKDEGKEFNPKAHTRDRLYLYNAEDSIASHKIVQEQIKELRELGSEDLYFNEIMPLVSIYKDIDCTGILVDQAQKEKLNIKYGNLLSSNVSILSKLIGSDKFNPRSPQQVGKLIYEELKFPKRIKTTEDGQIKYKTDKDTLDDLLINHGEENKEGKLGYNIISRIIICRKLSKVIEYINTPLHPDGRFHGSSNLAGTETGRSSFSKTIDEAWSEDKKDFVRLGRSLQTITKHGFHIDEEIFDDFEDATIANDLRNMFVPTPGYVFVECDGNSAEARVVAVLAEDYELLESFDKKPKIHAKTAAAIFNVDVNLISRDGPSIPKIGMTYYDLGKRARHAFNYKMGEFRLAQMSHLAIKECERILDVIKKLNPKIIEVYHNEIYNLVRKKRILVTPFRRSRQFFGRLDDHLYKQALAQIPQSTISDHTKFSLPRIKCEYKDVRFLTEQHDGFLSEVKKEDRDKFLEISKRIYERPINFSACSLSRDFDLVIPVELSWSEENWRNLREIKLGD